jgi:hypothetical protein
MYSWKAQKLALPTIVVGSLSIALTICAVTLMILYFALDSCDDQCIALPAVVCPLLLADNKGHFKHVGTLPVLNGVFTILDANKSQDKVFLNMTNNNSLFGAVDIALDADQTTYETLKYYIKQPFPVTTTTQTNLAYFPSLLSNVNLKVVILNNGLGWGVLVGGPVDGASARWCYSSKPYPNPLTDIVLVPASAEYASDVLIVDGKPMFVLTSSLNNWNIYVFAGDDVLGTRWSNTVQIADTKISKNAYKYLNFGSFNGTSGICFQKENVSPTETFSIVLIVSKDSFKTYKTVTVFESGYENPSLCVNPVTGLVRIASRNGATVSISTGDSLDSIFTNTNTILFTGIIAVLYLGNLNNDVMGLFLQQLGNKDNSLYLSNDKFTKPQPNIITVTPLATSSMKVVFATISQRATRIYAYNNDKENPLTSFVDQIDFSSWKETKVSTTALWNVGVCQISENLAIVCSYGALQNTTPSTAPIVTQVLGEELTQDMFYLTS